MQLNPETDLSSKNTVFLGYSPGYSTLHGLGEEKEKRLSHIGDFRSYYRYGRAPINELRRDAYSQTKGSCKDYICDSNFNTEDCNTKSYLWGNTNAYIFLKKQMSPINKVTCS